ncbi:MAG: glycerol-3-phosphate 1-O-acyltransferase [Desulfobulbaceae bacterium]|nr:MAG: glycerol-3-phosphate 1-O-acyltransferase [Desulfobulbaceae bacterium]
MDMLFVIASYLVGAIPFGLVLGRLSGVDVRNSGSGNIGATNVTRLLGKKLGVATLVLDSLKGFVPIYLAYRLLPESNSKELIMMLCGIMAVVGHMFPVYLRFQGGKGVATGLGLFLFLSPAAIAISLVIFVATVAVSGFVSAGSLLASGLFPLWLWLFGKSPLMIATGGVIGVLIWAKHRENIARLIRGEEKTWKKNKSADA